jgi:hypothetical protein
MGPMVLILCFSDVRGRKLVAVYADNFGIDSGILSVSV